MDYNKHDSSFSIFLWKLEVITFLHHKWMHSHIVNCLCDKKMVLVQSMSNMDPSKFLFQRKFNENL